MNKVSITTILRIILSIILLLLVYKETGAWTTFAIGTLLISNELSTYTIRLLNERINLLERR